MVGIFRLPGGCCVPFKTRFFLYTEKPRSLPCYVKSRVHIIESYLSGVPQLRLSLGIYIRVFLTAALLTDGTLWQTLISYCEWNLVFACMRRKHLSVQCRTIMSNWQIFGSGQFFNINKVFFGSLCAFTRIFLIHIAIPIKKWWITFSWLAESTTHWDQTIL